LVLSGSFLVNQLDLAQLGSLVVESQNDEYLEPCILVGFSSRFSSGMVEQPDELSVYL
jgi:hypothetical protein